MGQVSERPHFLYATVQFGEALLKRLLNRDGVYLSTTSPKLIFHVYADNKLEARDLVADMRAVAVEITAAANDLETFIDGFDFTSEPARA